MAQCGWSIESVAEDTLSRKLAIETKSHEVPSFAGLELHNHGIANTYNIL
jgi:hypothetical protein